MDKPLVEMSNNYLLPLNRGGRLARHVQDNTVDRTTFIGDTS